MTNPLNKVKQINADYNQLDAKDKKQFWVDGILNNALYILMALFVIYTASVKPNFLSLGSFANLITQVAAYLPMALGIAGCIVLTGTDLSAGRVAGLTAAVAGVLLQKSDFANKMFQNLPEVTIGWILVAMLAVVAIGAFIGLVNGFFVAKFSLHPFIVTLSTQLITYGIILWFFGLNGNNGQPISGVNVFWTTVLVHTLAGAMYGYAGFVEGVRSGSVAANTGLNAECDAIAACVIGGVSFVGGTGSISGIILGVFVLRIIFVALTMLGVDSSSLYIIKGAIILCACALDMRKYLVKK